MEEIVAQEQPEEAPQPGARREDVPQGGARRLRGFLRRNVTRRLGVTVVLWQMETRLATPVALVLVATIGRWPGALAMGGIMAIYSALFLFLLDGERVMKELRGWAQERRLMRRYVLPIAERRDGVGMVQRGLAVPVVVMFMGPFWRAVTFHLFRTRRPWAYLLSVGGSIPHSLLWTGLVLWGIWEGLVWPLIKDL